MRSGAMWWVLSTHAGRLDDMEATLAAHRGCVNNPLPRPELLLAAAVVRSGAMWWVLSKHAGHLGGTPGQRGGHAGGLPRLQQQPYIQT